MDATIIRDKLIGNDDERAVSPVIGVILMVAITVILAAVIAAFVMDLGDMSESANAGVDFDEDGDDVSVQIIDEGNTDSIYVEVINDGDSDFIDSDGEYEGEAIDDSPEAWNVGDSTTMDRSDHDTDGSTYDIDDGFEEITIYGEVGGDAQVIATWEE